MRRRISRILLIVISICGASIYCQAQLLIEFDDWGISIIPKKCVDTLFLKADKKGYEDFRMTLYLFNCKGESYIKVYDKKNVLRAEGKYTSSLDTLKRYNNAKVMGKPKDVSIFQVRILQYFKPLKIDEWIYYDKNGKVEYRTKYVYEFPQLP